MPVLENLMEGLASAAGADTAVARIEKKKGERKALSDEERQSNLELYNKAITNIQTHMGTLDPESSQYKTLQGALQKAVAARTQLFHPAQSTSPIGKLGELLHIKKPAATAATPTEDPLTAALTAGTPITKEKWKNTGKPTFNKETGLWSQTQVDTEGNQRVTPMPEGWTPPPLTELYDRVPGVVDGQVTTLWRDKHNPKHWVDQTGNDVPAETLAKFTALPPRNALGSESTTVDPFGVSSTTVRRPILPGVQPTAPPAKGAIPKTPGEAKKEAAKTAPKATAKAASKGNLQLDSQGNIPASYPANPYLKQAANRLLHNADVKDLGLPLKDVMAAQHLAAKFGYNPQGLFTPKEQLMVHEAETFLQQALNSPDLKVLDNATSRFKIMNAMHENPGIASDVLAVMWKMTPEEASYTRMLQRLIGVAAGLTPLTRAGRSTEANVKRLLNELSNPRVTQSSDDAKNRLQQMIDEINVAKESMSGSILGGNESLEDSGGTVLKYDPATGTVH